MSLLKSFYHQIYLSDLPVRFIDTNLSHQYLTNVQSWNRQTKHPTQKFTSMNLLQGPKKGLTDARSAVGFCLGSGLFGSYNSD